jgi:hypothetical protein
VKTTRDKVTDVKGADCSVFCGRCLANQKKNYRSHSLFDNLVVVGTILGNTMRRPECVIIFFFNGLI